MDYLGSVSLSNRSSDLFSLQKPLKSLYFKYLDTKLTGSAEEEALPGTLEITKTGLNFFQIARTGFPSYEFANEKDHCIVRRYKFNLR